MLCVAVGMLLEGLLDTVGLRQEPQVLGVRLAGIGLEDVVGKEDVGDMVLMDIVHHILRKVA